MRILTFLFNVCYPEERKKGFIHLNAGFLNYGKSHVSERLVRVFSTPTTSVCLSAP